MSKFLITFKTGAMPVGILIVSRGPKFHLVGIVFKEIKKDIRFIMYSKICNSSKLLNFKLITLNFYRQKFENIKNN